MSHDTVCHDIIADIQNGSISIAARAILAAASNRGGIAALFGCGEELVGANQIGGLEAFREALTDALQKLGCGGPLTLV